MSAVPPRSSAASPCVCPEPGTSHYSPAAAGRAARMETLFTWLHLSDLHVHAAREDDADARASMPALEARVLAALNHDLEEQAQDPIDALLVTGDVAWSGQREEYVVADAWLVGAARAAGLGPERVLVVPGNHDVDRSADRAPLTSKLVAELRGGRRRLDAALTHTRAREVLEARLYPYSVFAATFGPPPADDGAPTDALWWSHRIEGRRGLRVRLIGLSTAFLAEGDADRGRLRIGDRQLEAAAQTIQGGELTVVMAHHPARGGWLADEPDAEAWLRRHAHVLLSGHAHDPVADEARAGAPGPFVWVAAGAAPARRKIGLGSERRLGYAMTSVLRSGDGSLTLRVAPRRWSPEMGRFTLDDRHLARGEVATHLPLRLSLPGISRPTAPPPALARPSAPPPPVGMSAGSYSYTPSSPVPPPPEESAGPLAKSGPPLLLPPPLPPPLPVAPATAPALPRHSSSSRFDRSARPRPPPLPSEPPVPAAWAGQRVVLPQPPPLPGLASHETRPNAPAPVFTPPPSALRPLRAVSSLSSSDRAPAVTSREGPPNRPARALFEGPGGLPVMPLPLFTGHEAELDAIEDALARPSCQCVVVTGLGGVGKSALAQQLVATRAADLFEEGAWIDARDLAGELGRVAKRFGLRTFDRAPSAAEARAFLCDAIARRRVLLVVDDVNPGLADLGALPIPGGASRVIVTTRLLTLHEDLGRGARPVPVAPWSEEQSRAHLVAMVPALASEPEEVLDALARRVGGLPLGVHLLGRRLLRADVDVPSLIAKIEREPLMVLDGAARRGEATVTSTFGPAFTALAEPLRQVLVALAACARETRAAMVAEIVGVREDEATLALEGLAEQSLVEWDRDSDLPFRLPPVLRAFLRDQPGAAEAEAAHESLVLGSVIAHTDPTAWREAEADLPEALAVVERRTASGDPSGAWEVLKAIHGLLERRDRYADFINAARRIVRAAPEDGPTAPAVLADLGLSLAALGDIPQARRCLDRALALAEQRGYRDTEALALGGLGRVHAILGDLDQATASYRRAAALHEALGMRRFFALDLANVGLLLRRSGNVGEAIELLERALALHEQIGELEGRAEALGGLGLCYRDIGQLEAAVEQFQRALEIHGDLGRRAGQATMLGNLGNTYRAGGNLGEAVNHLERALAIYEELGMPEGQGAALGNLGACYRALGDHQRAYDAYERALDALRHVGLPDEHPHVRVILGALAELGRRPRG